MYMSVVSIIEEDKNNVHTSLIKEINQELRSHLTAQTSDSRAAQSRHAKQVNHLKSSILDLLYSNSDAEACIKKQLHCMRNAWRSRGHTYTASVSDVMNKR